MRRPTVRTTLADEAATQAFAVRLASALPHGALLLLDGPLGAGKTTLVAALVAALGGPDRTSSPTYTLVHEYPTPEGPIVHVDAYRLDDEGALDALALELEAYLDHARLVAVEWGGRLADRHPEAWRLRIDRPTGSASGRTVEVVGPHR